MIGTALMIGLILWLVMEKTRMGAAVRATVDDAQMARGVGIDTSRISMFVFALGAFLAALGGVIGGAFLGIYPGLDFEILPLAFAVVIIGGMGSLGAPRSVPCSSDWPTTSGRPCSRRFPISPFTRRWP